MNHSICISGFSVFFKKPFNRFCAFSITGNIFLFDYIVNIYSFTMANIPV